MKDIYAVIGANYGDEGKGRTVDYLCDSLTGSKVVVRFNGGAQAGHTVVRHPGLSHTFSHFGSGSFHWNVATYLSEFFVCSPIFFHAEHRLLKGKAPIKPVVYVHPDSPVTTPYDIFINRIIERRRGDAKHGSCGMGFNETIVRNIHTAMSLPVMSLQVKDLYGSKESLRERCEYIRHLWVRFRLGVELGIPYLSYYDNDPLLSDGTLDQFLRDVEYFKSNVEYTEDYEALAKHDVIIFEGAQGLLLDQNSKDFPHVTRSNTGLKNVMAIMDNPTSGLASEQITPVYVTRPYVTRHGRGPMLHEVDKQELKLRNTELETNVHSEWQEHFRYGHLNIDQLSLAIDEDLRHSNHAPNRIKKLALSVTCLDQLTGQNVAMELQAQVRRSLMQMGPNVFLYWLSEMTGASEFILGYGHTAKDTLRVQVNNFDELRNLMFHFEGLMGQRANVA